MQRVDWQEKLIFNKSKRGTRKVKGKAPIM